MIYHSNCLNSNFTTRVGANLYHLDFLLNIQNNYINVIINPQLVFDYASGR